MVVQKIENDNGDTLELIAGDTTMTLIITPNGCPAASIDIDPYDMDWLIDRLSAWAKDDGSDG